MTSEEAIKVLRTKIHITCILDLAAEELEAISMGIEALEKQIPKKPTYSDYGEDDDGEELIPYEAACPTCGYEFEFGTWNEEENHHCVCGQAIDWGEE